MTYKKGRKETEQRRRPPGRLTQFDKMSQRFYLHHNGVQTIEELDKHERIFVKTFN